LYGVFLHTKPPPRGKSPVAAPQRNVGRGTREDAYEGVVR
jgi:hypothetical protein